MTKVYKIGSIFLLEKMIQSSKYSYHFYNLASCGRVDVFRYLEKKGMMVPEEEELLYVSAKNGQLDMVKWLCSHNIPVSDRVYFICAENGHLSILQWLYSQPQLRLPTHSGLPDNIVRYAIRSEKIEALSWLHEIGVVFCVEDMLEATRQGNLAIVKWLCERNCPWNTIICSSASVIIPDST